MNVEWVVIRGSGLVAYALLSAATIWGLLISTRLLGRLAKAKPLTFFHESLGLGSLVATGVHLAMLAIDDYIEFGAGDLLVPGLSTWRPTAVALGVMAFYGAVMVSLTFYVKRWIGQHWWRNIHFLSLGSFAAALLHGILAGTDTAHPVVMATYVVTGTLVLGLVAVRLFLVTEDQRSASKSSRRRAESGHRVSGTDQVVHADEFISSVHLAEASRAERDGLDSGSVDQVSHV